MWTEENSTQDRTYPQYLMRLGTERQFLSMKDAGRAYDSGHLPVEIVGLVLEATHQVRGITEEEHSGIVHLADEYSASK